MEKVNFIRMDQGTKEEYAFLDSLEKQHAKGLPDRILKAMTALDDGLQGYQISRLQHSLQTARRAENAGADKDMIAAALIHDIGDELSPFNHARFAAAILAPYVRKEVAWVVDKHGIFQYYYYGDKIGVDPDLRRVYLNNPYYHSCLNFCESWDQMSFDPNYETPELSYYAPLIHEVFSRRQYDPAILGEGPDYDSP